MSRHRTFVDRALAGEILDVDEEVDADVARWHEAETDLSLYEWLGLSLKEYGLFVERPGFLRAILTARHYQVTLEEAVSLEAKGTPQLAARNIAPDDLPKIREWLEQTGRL